MKKLAMALALLLAVALLPMAAVAEEDEKPDMRVYVWLQDMGIDFAAVLDQVPTSEALKQEQGSDWEKDGNSHAFSFDMNGKQRMGHVMYHDDGSIRLVDLYNVLGDHVPDRLTPQEALAPLQSLVYFYYDREAVECTVYLYRSGEYDSIRTLYNKQGRMTECVYQPEKDVTIRMNACGQLELDGTDIDQATVDRIGETYGFPTLIGDPYDFKDVTFAPDIQVYAALQDTGIDVAALLEAAPHPEAGESEILVTDEQGNEVYAEWNTAAGTVRTLMVNFAQPVAGSWEQMWVYPQNGDIELSAPGCGAFYDSDGELQYYGYMVSSEQSALFAPDGTMMSAPTDNEILLALYTPLEIIPASQDYSGMNMLGIEKAVTRVIYATVSSLNVDLAPYIEMDARFLEAFERDGMILVPDDGYEEVYLETFDSEADRVEIAYGDPTDGAWLIDPSGLDLGDGIAATIYTYKYDEAGNLYSVVCDYPSMESYVWIDFSQPDANGYSHVEVSNGYHDKFNIYLTGIRAYAYYDLEGNLTEYSYTADDGTQVKYSAEGELIRVSTSADPANYPPLEIIGE